MRRWLRSRRTWVVLGALIIGATMASYPAIQAHRKNAAIERIRRAGGGFTVRPRGPDWLREWTPINLGYSPSGGVAIRDAGITDEEFAQIVDDLNLIGTTWALDLSGSDIGDEGVRELHRLEHLVWLDLSSTRVTDEGLASVGQIEGLEDLSLANTAVTDAGLVHLGSLRRLQHLNLDHTAVSDKGMPALAKLQRLTELNISDTNVTDTGLATLSAESPQVSVWDD